MISEQRQDGIRELFRSEIAKKSNVRSRPEKSAPHGYHHGDLRRHLIGVGEQLLDEKGIKEFTLQECARRQACPAWRIVGLRIGICPMCKSAWL